MKKSSITVVGLSHLGVVSSIGFASLGFRVIGIDSNETTVSSLKNNNNIFPNPV